jgi:hypothetical protein
MNVFRFEGTLSILTFQQGYPQKAAANIEAFFEIIERNL